ncbi:aminotransferase class I/II-fold pyridoxal phosphate-dependent enzyme [Luteimonas fraxinea]|uniref:aminotransferase class I/II-fold pyridoxal phosphate-dependent enzyme n=1 Tax=Luteimonas fraxinea TaxID=2901869 RepID=UPI001E5A9C8F|nr:aminotransferase class I/II-fold pyridoxal phosphate-dependent enzyme [Luteimonas fraxinea]MCD9124379.1 DegT/DnrJ/EryC1/StrS family aminotransferase [Luteimonas fraxinea]
MKTITARADLALYGAPPAYTEIVHVGRPNIVAPDVYLGRVASILQSRWLTNNGPVVQEFEARLAAYLGVRHCVVTSNATVGLEIAIRALGLSGEVILPSWTFIATAHALSWQGITPVFADVLPGTHNVDPASVERLVTSRTTGIIGVHLWGRCADIAGLQAVAERHRLKLMFDAAHAFGSRYGGRRVGRFGSCEVFSFHATKALNSMEGGAIATNDDALAQAARLMRNFGFEDFDRVVHLGTNGKMVEVCAAMGLVNLDAFEDIVAVNRRIHTSYRDALAGIAGISLLQYAPEEENSHHYVVLEIGAAYPASRDEVVAALRAENIVARKYFWPGCHRMKPYAGSPQLASTHLRVTEEISERVIVLPTGTALPDGAVGVIAAVVRCLGQRP